MTEENNQEPQVPNVEVKVKPSVRGAAMSVMAIAAAMSAGGNHMMIERGANQVRIRPATKKEIAEKQKKKNKRKMASKSRKANRR